MRYRVIESDPANPQAVGFDSIHDTADTLDNSWDAEYIHYILRDDSVCVWRDCEDGRGRLFSQWFLREDCPHFGAAAVDVMREVV